MLIKHPRRRSFATQLFSATVSSMALLAASSAVAQTTSADPQNTAPVPSNAASPTKPAGVPSAGTFSGTADPQAASTPPVGNSAGGTAGTAGSSDTSEAGPPDRGVDEIVVTGTRQSLANAQSIKKNADTVVDAITADDIGSLPDRSVNEALQRVPGVAISRFAAPSDSAHYSAQGSGVVIRGLTYVKSEFNGRDTFAVGSGREIGFNDVPSELVGSIEVFKNLTSDMIEGGIAGTVNINQRKPFDSKDNLLFLSGGMNYGDLIRRGTPQGVALISHQWQMPFGGRIGVLGSVSYQQIRSRADSVFTSSYLPRYNDDKNGNGIQDPGEGRIINAGTPYQSTLFDTYPVPAGRNYVYVPLGAGSREEQIDRKRIGYAAGLQYESDGGHLLVTAQFLRADSKDDHLDRSLEPNVYYGDVNSVFPVGATAPTYDDNGIFTSGTLGKTTGQVFGNRPDGTYGPLTELAPNGVTTTETNRHFVTRSITQDQNFNIKWQPTERLKVNLDAQYVKSRLSNTDDILDTATYSQSQINVSKNGMTLTSITPGFDVNKYFADPNSLFFNDAFNNIQHNNGHEWAFRGDVQYDVSDNGFLRSLRVGGRYADREQTVRANNYNNWGNVSATWGSAGPISFADLPATDRQLFSFGSDFWRGGTNQPPSISVVPDAIVRNHDAFEDLLRQVTKLGGGSYTPLEDRKTSDGSPLIDGIFLPSEVYRNGEKTFSGYVRADFGLDELPGGMSLSGNVGVRFVRTEDSATGALTFPQQSQVFTPAANGEYANNVQSYCAYTLARPNGNGTVPAICTVTAAQQNAVVAFANGASTPNVAKQNFNDWLPSLNLKLQITDKLLARFAASRAISRPNFGQVQNFVTISPSGANTTGSYTFQASSQNPFLKPVKATQLDGTLEWYFAKVGSLTGAVFYKDLSNIILDNYGFTRSVTNDGQTFDITVNGPANAKGHGNVKGVELSYQQTYDFLPGLLKGLGMQATYTFIKTSSIPNSVPANAAADGSRPPLDVSGIYNGLPLALLSKHNFNINGFYDYGGLDLRLAYSWRSRYLLTNRDCCFPYLPVFAEAGGQMDASVFYTVNKNFKIGLQGQNLLDQTTKTTFQINAEGLRAPRSFFKNDRTFLISARVTL